MTYLLTVTDQHRARIFHAVLGTNEVPVTTMQPLQAVIPGMGARWVYFLNLSDLAPEQVESLIEYSALETNSERGEVAEKILSGGFLILAQDASIKAIDQPGFTLSVVFPSGSGGN